MRPSNKKTWSLVGALPRCVLSAAPFMTLNNRLSVLGKSTHMLIQPIDLEPLLSPVGTLDV